MKIHSGGHLTFYMPQRKNSVEIRLTAPKRLTDLLEEMKIPLAEVHLVALNGNQAVLEEVILNDTDTVHIYSSVDGG